MGIVFLRKRALRAHALFLAGLLVAYLCALYLYAWPGDAGNAGHDAVRVLAAVVELAVAGLVMGYPLRRWRARRSRGWFVLYLLLAAGVCAVYAAQIYALYLSGNFISVLGIRNAHYAAATRGRVEWIIFGAGAAWVAILAILSRRATAGQVDDGEGRAGYGRVLVFALMALLYVWVFTLQRQRVTLAPDYRQVPLASLAVNLGVALGRSAAPAPPPAGRAYVSPGQACFSDPAAGHVSGYPFQKDVVYRDALTYAIAPGAPASPNVIVIFTEGLSARMLGAYGGAYPGLTPNIDRLAVRSMRVTDYYNHTAATFRGLIGQNSSGYTFNGGAGSGGWMHGNNAGSLATIQRQTLAGVLQGHGYDTVFFDPDPGTAFDGMLRSLGFRQRYGLDRISALLDGHVGTLGFTGQLDDGTLFRALGTWLRERAASGNRKPFYLGLYNMGTHAFIPMVRGGHAYRPHPNRFLDKLHNYDAALGTFLDYFRTSPYARNTILVFTTDHATYPDPVYRAVAGEDLKPYFVDRIPLLIDDPTHALPATLDAHGRNSLDLAPTLLQLLGVQRAPNSFLGTSLFEARSFRVGMTAIGDQYYLTLPPRVVPIWAAPAAMANTAKCERKVVSAYYALEAANRLFTRTPSHAPRAGVQPVFAYNPAAHAAREAPSPGVALCALDALDGKVIAHNGKPVELAGGGTLAAQGWLVDAEHDSVASMDLVLTPLVGGAARSIAATTTRLERPDVVQAIRSEGALHSGFRVHGDTRGLTPGPYRVTAQAGRGASRFTCDFHVMVNIGSGTAAARQATIGPAAERSGGSMR